MHVPRQLHACSPRLLYRDRLIDSLMHPGNPVSPQDQLRRHVAMVAMHTPVHQPTITPRRDIATIEKRDVTLLSLVLNHAFSHFRNARVEILPKNCTKLSHYIRLSCYIMSS